MSDEKKEERIVTCEFRVSYPNVFKPKAPYPGKEPVYSLDMLFPKDADIMPLKRLVKAAIDKKWPNNQPPTSSMKLPFKDGDQHKNSNYDGFTVCRAASKYQPGVIDQKKNDILDPKEFYSGCWARATLIAYAYDTAGNKGVSLGLQNLQKLRDDEAFSGMRSAQDDFDAVESGGDFAEDNIDF